MADNISESDRRTSPASSRPPGPTTPGMTACPTTIRIFLAEDQIMVRSALVPHLLAARRHPPFPASGSLPFPAE